MSGEATVPMYKLEIRNQKGKVIKTYQTDGIYILNAAFDEDMITLERASKDGDTYTATAPDYITNNEQKTKSNITLETYATDLKQTQVRLTYNDGISEGTKSTETKTDPVRDTADDHIFRQRRTGEILCLWTW